MLLLEQMHVFVTNELATLAQSADDSNRHVTAQRSWQVDYERLNLEVVLT